MPSPSKQRQKVSYTLYIASKSVLDTPYSVKKCLLDSLSVLSEVAGSVPKRLQGKRLLSLELGLLVADTKSRRALALIVTIQVSRWRNKVHLGLAVQAWLFTRVEKLLIQSMYFDFFFYHPRTLN